MYQEDGDRLKEVRKVSNNNPGIWVPLEENQGKAF